MTSEPSELLLAAVDDVLRALALEPAGNDRFRAPGEPGLFGHLYGGQLVAQALLAACATAPDQEPNSVHAYFVEPGITGTELDLTVDRVRDGRSVVTRSVRVEQDGRPLLVALASFHTNVDSPEVADPPPAAPTPDDVPPIEDWVRRLPAEQDAIARGLLEQPLAIEQRMAEPPTYLGGEHRAGSRSHWMRVPRLIGDDPNLHRAMLAYASDHLLMDMVFRAHPDRPTGRDMVAVSLDHAIWFHRPVRFDQWHLYTQEATAITGHRGLTRGVVHDGAGHLVATVTQEVLVRPNKGSR